MEKILLAMCVGASWVAAYYAVKAATAAKRTEQYVLALLALLHEEPEKVE